MNRLAAHRLRKSFNRREVVQDVSLEVNRGEVVGLLGPNGAGKTTCFYMIVGLIQPDAGQILLDDVDLTRKPMHVRARSGIGYLPQEASVFRGLSVRANIMAALECVGVRSRAERNRRTEALLEDFGLHRIETLPGRALSGGERRRVEIARALAGEPRFILLDEPFAGVDPISVADIKDIIRTLTRRDIGVLITDHNVRETLDICRRAYIVASGTLLAEGSPAELLANESVKTVYLGEAFEL